MNFFEGMKKDTYKEITIEPIQGWKIPVVLFKGKYEGLTVLFTAQIHASEFVGTAALIKLSKSLKEQTIKGNIILMPCVNTPGFYEGSDAFVPFDEGNLNQIYPGKEDGSESERLAHWFINKVFSEIDYLFDLHGGGDKETLTPCIFTPTHPKIQQRSIDIATHTTIPYLISSYSKVGEFSYAANVLGIPALLLERGYSGICKEEWIDDYLIDIQMILAFLGCIKQTSQKSNKHIFYDDVCYLESEYSGVWHSCVLEDQNVYQGDLLGYVENFFGEVLKEYHAEYDGKVFYYNSSLRTIKGDCLMAYSKNKGKIINE